jgi:predicted SprT family Zn-dependent metalloprotease
MSDTPAPSLFQRSLEIGRLAYDLLARHGLHDWSFAFNRRRTSLGMCYFHRKAIELSIFFVQRNGPELILDTLLHEIAHALVGPGHGHDAVWKRMCLKVGAKPERLCHEAEMPAGRWRALCGGCGTVHQKYRRPKRMKWWFCRACGPEKGRLAWVCC